MQAAATRAGGRHLAVERGAADPEAIALPSASPATATLFECLSAAEQDAMLTLYARLGREEKIPA